jgi:hypothetical protein
MVSMYEKHLSAAMATMQDADFIGKFRKTRDGIPVDVKHLVLLKNNCNEAGRSLVDFMRSLKAINRSQAASSGHAPTVV